MREPKTFGAFLLALERQLLQLYASNTEVVHYSSRFRVPAVTREAPTFRAVRIMHETTRSCTVLVAQGNNMTYQQTSETNNGRRLNRLLAAIYGSVTFPE